MSIYMQKSYIWQMSTHPVHKLQHIRRFPILPTPNDDATLRIVNIPTPPCWWTANIVVQHYSAGHNLCLPGGGGLCECGKPRRILSLPWRRTGGGRPRASRRDIAIEHGEARITDPCPKRPAYSRGPSPPLWLDRLPAQSDLYHSPSLEKDMEVDDVAN